MASTCLAATFAWRKLAALVPVRRRPANTLALPSVMSPHHAVMTTAVTAAAEVDRATSAVHLAATTTTDDVRPARPVEVEAVTTIAMARPPDAEAATATTRLLVVADATTTGPVAADGMTMDHLPAAAATTMVPRDGIRIRRSSLPRRDIAALIAS